MTAQELETELAKVRGEIATLAAELRAKDATLDERSKTTDLKVKATEDLAISCDKRLDVLKNNQDHLKTALDEEKADRAKWGGRVWQLIAVAFGCLLTGVVAIGLAWAGVRKIGVS